MQIFNTADVVASKARLKHSTVLSNVVGVTMVLLLFGAPLVCALFAWNHAELFELFVPEPVPTATFKNIDQFVASATAAIIGLTVGFIPSYLASQYLFLPIIASLEVAVLENDRAIALFGKDGVSSVVAERHYRRAVSRWGVAEENQAEARRIGATLVYSKNAEASRALLG